MADNRKLAQGLMMMTPSARADLAQREGDIQRGKTVELLRRAGQEMYDNPIVNTAIGFTPVIGDIQAGAEAYRSAQQGNYGEAGLNALGVLPFLPALGGVVKNIDPSQIWYRGQFGKFAESEPFQSSINRVPSFADNPKIASAYAENPNASGFNFPESAKEGANVARYTGKGKVLDMNEYQGKIAGETGISKSEYNRMLRDVGISKQEAEVLTSNLPHEWAQKYGSGKNVFWDAAEPSTKTKNRVIAPFKIIEDPEFVDMLQKRGIDAVQFKGTMVSPNDVPDLNMPWAEGIMHQEFRPLNENAIQPYGLYSDEIPQILERNGQPVAQALRNYEAPQKQIANIPLSEIEHGESAMPGGKLSFPESRGLIKEYAEMPTEIPPIQVMAPDEAGGKWMIYDGSHRYEAAKLRGMKEIPVELENIDDIEAARKAGYLK